jgi:glutamyl-tRNA synthetase
VTSPVRVRFAPSPTGVMHIGNIRAALLNYLFAHQKKGTFILRIEDTDAERNFDPGAKTIIADLTWLSLFYDEGPEKGGPDAPYFQSERQSLYQNTLDQLIEKKLVYRCFCTEEELEKKRERQRALKLPPRYDRACLRMPKAEIEKRLAQGIPFVWRFMLNHDVTIKITDLARGTVSFDLKNFSDFPLTRSDGSFTFMFANFVDDMLMKITHVFRGEDHLSNTAGQAALYQAFNAPVPIFWHLPIICNVDGTKLSKRDFGFSLHDLKNAGFLPQAINNYLAIIGGSYPNEIMNMEELAQVFNFETPYTSGTIKYDVEKLRWVNHQWINRLSDQELADATLPYLVKVFPSAAQIDKKKLVQMLQIIKSDLYTLQDAANALKFYFESPQLQKISFQACISPDNLATIANIIRENIGHINDTFVDAVKAASKQHNIPIKETFWFLRLALMGEINGPSIHDLITILGPKVSKERIEQALQLI